MKIALVPTQSTQYSQPNSDIKADSLHFKGVLIVSVHIHCYGIHRLNDDNNVTVLDDLLVLSTSGRKIHQNHQKQTLSIVNEIMTRAIFVEMSRAKFPHRVKLINDRTD